MFTCVYVCARLCLFVSECVSVPLCVGIYIYLYLCLCACIRACAYQIGLRISPSLPTTEVPQMPYSNAIEAPLKVVLMHDVVMVGVVVMVRVVAVATKNSC